MSIRTLLALTVVLTCTSALADTPEPPLRVSVGGADTGSCQLMPCGTLGYALQRVGKTGRIDVAPGRYQLQQPEDVVYLLSGSIDVRAEPGAQLVGVPAAFAAALQAKGFRAIVDSKGLDADRRETNRKLVEQQSRVHSVKPPADCVAGLADVFTCSNVDLLSNVGDRAASTRGADIWGFMDLNTHREYAIMGYANGTAVYDVTDAENPREVGFVDGQATTWRDIKVHQFWNATDGRWNAYAYVSADATTDGLIIIDLTELPHRISRAAYQSDFNQAHNVYLTDAEFSTGLSITGDAPLLLLAGSEQSDGRFRGYTLGNPASPAFIAAPSTPSGQPGGDRLYMHDGASMVVTDARKDTQCVNGSDHCDIVFDFNEDTLDIWDVTTASNPVRLSRTPYSNASYTHSGWWTEDQQFVFVQDELDERDRLLNTTLRVFDISNLTAPAQQAGWSGPTRAIDHNGFVRGNRYYMSNYARGLTILDITDAAAPQTVGRFDTYPASDNVGFPGAWGAYPYLPSGHIAVSDIDSGLYMLRDNTLDVSQGTLGFIADSFGGDETQPLEVSVARSGGTQGAVGVSWELIGATADGSDVTLTAGTLNWADGDAANKNISLGLINDGVAEDLERVLLRLIAPTGGATLSAPNIASAWIADPGSTSGVGFAESQIAALERGFGQAIVVLNRTGSASGAVSVDFSVSNGDATAGSDYNGPASGTVSWADGDANPKWIEYSIVDDGSGEPDEFIELSLSNAAGAGIDGPSVMRIDVIDGTGSNSAPNAVAGSAQTVAVGATVTLDGGGSNDPNGDTLSYAWLQTLGPAVTLNGADTAAPTFSAPSVSSDTLFRFELTVTDPSGLSDQATASVTVTAGNTPAGGGGSSSGGGAFALWSLLGLIGIALIRINRTGAS